MGQSEQALYVMARSGFSLVVRGEPRKDLNAATTCSGLRFVDKDWARRVENELREGEQGRSDFYSPDWRA